MNTQNIPRNDKTVKRGFIPKLDYLLFFDYDSIELRLLAFYMHSVGDDSMVKAFLEGKDIHAESAKAIFDKSEVTEQERDVGKTFNYATVYGQGVAKCALVLGISFDDARTMLGRFEHTWPGITLLHRLGKEPGAIQRQIRRNGYISTLHGRHLFPEAPHQALNYLLQPAAADIFKGSLIESHRWASKQGVVSHLINAVHDEQIWDCNEEEVKIVVENVPKCMDFSPVSSVIPLPIGVEISGKSWADKEEYQEV